MIDNARNRQFKVYRQEHLGLFGSNKICGCLSYYQVFKMDSHLDISNYLCETNVTSCSSSYFFYFVINLKVRVAFHIAY